MRNALLPGICPSFHQPTPCHRPLGPPAGKCENWNKTWFGRTSWSSVVPQSWCRSGSPGGLTENTVAWAPGQAYRIGNSQNNRHGDSHIHVSMREAQQFKDLVPADTLTSPLLLLPFYPGNCLWLHSLRTHRKSVGTGQTLLNQVFEVTWHVISRADHRNPGYDHGRGTLALWPSASDP